MSVSINNKIRVAVLFGGRSAEHEVSLKSAANVIQNLDTDLFDVIPVGIDKEGSWFMGKDVFAHSLEHNFVKQLADDSYTWFTPEWVSHAVTKQARSELAITHQQPAFDVVFPVVHGTFCEDGTLQGLLELTGLPYVGCGVLSSSMGMDKDISKRLAIHAGIRVPDYIVIKQEQWQLQKDIITKQILEKIPLPIFIKPANTGSSIGISKVKTREQLVDAIDLAFKFDTKVLVEEGLNVLELELAVLESLEPGQDPLVSVVGEIVPSHEFYSYDAKYLDENGAELLIPASVDAALQEQARQMAKTLFTILECEGMARVDLFYNKDTEQLYFNEINTIPGFTKISMYPKLMEASGVSYQKLLTHLIQLALKRHQVKSKLVRSYT